MKKNYILTLVGLVCALFTTAQTLPTFSTDGNETWYFIQFKNGSAVLQDMGEGSNLMTKAAVKNEPSQLWKVTGTQSDCEIVSQNGRHIYYNTSANYYAASASQTGGLKLAATTNTSYMPAWEIQQKSVAGKSMNQWGGSGAGKYLGSWNANDVNNPLQFIVPADMDIPDPEPTVEKEFRYVGYKYTSTPVPVGRHTLWYIKPVTAETVSNPWMEYALPIGNGQFGGMVYGGVHQDRVQFNDKTLWTGSPTKRGAYQNFGCLYIDCNDDFSTTSTAGRITGYYRTLDLDNATATMCYMNTDSTVTYKREYIASNPDGCIAIRLTASEAGKLNNKFYLYNPNGSGTKYTAAGEGAFSGTLDLVSYNARMRVIPTGGTMTVDATGVTVAGADEILVILAGGTNFNPKSMTYIDDKSTLAPAIENRVSAASAKDWNMLYTAHVADYKSFFDRCVLTLKGAGNELPTNTLVTYYNTASKNMTGKEATSLMLEELYFTYGRYLLIASSRGVDLPANLQGIWNNSAAPPWESDIHSNINVQMNYWPAESTNLSELHEKYLNYIYNMAEVHTEWQKYAQNSGQSTGWTCYTQNNIFGHSDFMENYVIANAWYCSHLWQHYRYTLDKAYLKATAFPAMLSCTKYWMERLKLATDGTYECPAEWSPEHGPGAENATAHAQQLTWDLFNNTLKAIEALGTTEAGVDDAFVTELKEKFSKLDTGLAIEQYQGTFGATRNGVATGDDILREWKYTSFASGNGSESGHRHMSHLMCLYPCDQISQSSPYFTPAVNALKLRGDVSTGWSMGWKINLWARALDGDHAHAILKAALKHSTSYGTDQWAGGIYYNLFDSHAPFQIDGNFGACAGVAEMLLQSQTDTIKLLPALPAVWEEGNIKGLRATNNFTVDVNWATGKAAVVTVTSGSGTDCSLSYPGIGTATLTSDGATLTPTIVNDSTITFPTEAGKKYIVNFGIETGIGCIPSVTESDFLKIDGHKVSVLDTAIKSVEVNNLQGASVLSTSKRTFTIPASADKIYLLSAKYANGQTRSFKVLLK